MKQTTCDSSQWVSQEKVDELIKENQRITQRETAVKLAILQECVGHIIDVLQYQKVCAWWFACMLTAEMKAPRAKICQKLLWHYGNEDEEFLHIMTANETRCIIMNLKQSISLEYHHKGSPEKITSAGKLMASVFWDADDVSHMDFLEPGTPINSKHYTATLRTLKEWLRRVQKHKNILLQHHSARPHISRTTTEAKEKLDLTNLPCPPYSDSMWLP